jgi:hypothetical protein
LATILAALLVQALVLLLLALVVMLVFRPPMNWSLPFGSPSRPAGWGNGSRPPRNGDDQRHQVIRQMRSRRNPLALEAVQIAREKGWLADGGLRRTTLRLADLQGANLEGANLEDVDLSYANLSRSNLAGANLCRARFAQANLHGARLDGADLREASLADADLSGVTLKAALYDSKTGWPSTFDPVAAEAIDVDQLLNDERQRVLAQHGKIG